MGKLDLIPGRINATWLQADRPGTYRGECAEFCLALAGGLVAHPHWQQIGRADALSGYPRFMALFGLLLNALFAYALILEGLPVAFLSPCW